jgi:hypothetical protein
MSFLAAQNVIWVRHLTHLGSGVGILAFLSAFMFFLFSLPFSVPAMAK